MDDIEAIGLSTISQQFHVAFSPCAKAVVMAHHHRGAAEAIDEHVSDEIRGLEAAKRSIKRLDHQMVKPCFGQRQNPLVQGLKQLESTVFAKQDLPGMRIEGEHDGFRIFCGRLLDHPVEQRPVAEVDAIERAGGDDASGAFREMGKTAVNVHCVKGRERYGGV